MYKPLAQVSALTQYSAWGFVTFLLGLGALYVLYDICHVPYWIAVPLSVGINLVAHYTASRRFVFTKTERPIEQGLVIFIFIGILEILFITGGVTLLIEYTAADLYWARIGVGIVAAVFGFLANARFNFKAL